MNRTYWEKEGRDWWKKNKKGIERIVHCFDFIMHTLAVVYMIIIAGMVFGMCVWVLAKSGSETPKILIIIIKVFPAIIIYFYLKYIIKNFIGGAK